MKTLRLVGCLLLLAACADDGDFFFLRNDSADMPIVVKGNTASNVFILFLHGGPGNGTYVWEDYFKPIEAHYAIVYWNQRAAGESQGNSKPTRMTVAQFVKDTDKVVTLINKLYNHPKIFLMGHSWGGLLGTAYLVEKSNGANPISGWIEVDGAHNKVLGEQYSRQWVINYATAQVAAGKDVGYWNNALAWYASWTGPLTYTSKHYTEYLPKAHAYYYGEEPSQYSVSDYFFGRPNGFDLLLSGTYNDKTMGDEVAVVNLSPEMNIITIPSLLLWGRHDGAIPYPMAQDAYDALGTAAPDKQVIYFESSAHSPMIEENAAFCAAVNAFVGKYR